MMASEQCPACSGMVERDEDHCPSCGSLLDPTMPEERTASAAEEGARGLQFLPGTTFAERFTIIERIGCGGMGVVYKAIDKVLNSEIALKLILPELARNTTYLERFKREVRITRQITHPNICRVHDIGNSEGLIFLSMEWIEGETLQQLLRKTGMLKEARALAIAESIAWALEAAHDKGMVHRDLKPANIMLGRRGNVYVLDFGLALEQGREQFSRVGAAIGTPLYMSPEQKERHAVDARTDLYALGLILREMLTGQRPTIDEAPGGSLSAGINPLIAPLLDRLLARRDERYESAAALRREIQRLLLEPAISTSSALSLSQEGDKPFTRKRGLWFGSAAAAAVIIAAAGAYYFMPASSTPELDPQAAVFYARGLHHLRDKGELGTSRTLGDAIQMFHRALNHEPESALILARLGEAHWLRFEEKGLLSSREEAERAVSRAVELDPDLPEVRNARALGYMIEGKYEAAKAELEPAVEAKPGFGTAWINLGEVHQNLGNYAEGLEALNRALKLEPGNARLQIRLGLFHQHFGENDEARSCFVMATDLNPESFHAWNDLGTAYLFTGNYDEAIPAFERAVAIREEAAAVSNIGTALYFLGSYEEAVGKYLRATALQPGAAVHWGNLGDTLLVLGREQRATEAYAQAASAARARTDREGISPDALSAEALYCAKAKDAECAISQAAAALELQPDNPKIMLTSAAVNCILGNDAESLEWLDRAVKLGLSKAEIELVPEFTRLHEDSRYKRILELAS